MNRTGALRRGRFLAVLAACALAFPPAVHAAGSTQNVTFLVGHSVVLPVHDVRRVALGDPACVGVVAVGTSKLILNGKAPCKTSLFVWSAQGDESVYEVSVVNAQLNDVAQAIRSAISQPDVQIVNFGQGIIVRGSVPDMAAYVQLSDLLDHFTLFAQQNRYTIVNAVTIAHSLQSIQHDFEGVAGVSELQIEPDGKGNVIISGQVPDGLVESRVIARAQSLAGPFLAADGKVIDRLDVSHATEVDVKVEVLEVDDTGLSQLGVRLQSGLPDPNNPKNLILGNPFFPIIEDTQAAGIGKAFNFGAFYRTTVLVPTLDLLLQSGHARVLSQPDVVALPGVQATFLVGGEIPYIFSTGIGQVSVLFKNYGVQLNLTPEILPSGSIRTKVNPDISDLDYQNAVTFNGFFFPALKESSMSTELVTAPGQSIVMGGLLRHLDEKTITKIPLLSQIPILGKLFQSTRYQTGQTDVVFVMTPKIVNQ
jgi:Flp pilus assembly secretin CpaC